MGKKNKKKSQKNRQAKALKRRSLKKTIQKQKPNRKSPQFPGLPGGMPPGGVPPGMMEQMETMAKVTEPLFNMANPTSMPQMQSMVALMQSFTSAFDEQDLEKRQTILENVKIAYTKQSWATMEFAELADLILKRHIYYLPDAHTEEERAQFSDEELKAAVDEAAEGEDTETPQFQLPDVGINTSILDKLSGAEEEDLSPASFFPQKEEISKTESPVDTEPILDISEETIDDDAPVKPISEEILKPEDIDTSEVQSLLNQSENSDLAESYNFLKKNCGDTDFIDENNPVLQKTLEFQNNTLDLFERYLQDKNLTDAQARSHLQSLRPFFSEFLKEYHQSSILNCDEDQVEEYLLDFFIRKVAAAKAGKRYALSAFKLFFTFAEKLDYVKNSSEILERIEDIRAEYEEFVQE